MAASRMSDGMGEASCGVVLDNRPAASWLRRGRGLYAFRGDGPDQPRHSGTRRRRAPGTHGHSRFTPERRRFVLLLKRLCSWVPASLLAAPRNDMRVAP